MTRDSIFKLDRKFVKELCGRLSRPNKYGFRFEPSEIPTVDQMEGIISATIWASTQQEEGRLSRFRIAFGEPFILDHLALIFQVHKRWGVEELRKLAPAVGPFDGHIGVWPTGPQGELQIWGLLTNSMLQLTFEVIDPGRITVSMLPNDKVAEITGQRVGFVSPDWNSNALELLSPPDSDIGRTTVAVAMSILPMHATQEILRQMRLLGHGGAIIFVSDGNRWEKSIERPIFYACSQKLNKITRLMAAFSKEVSRIEQDDASFDVGKTKSCFELFNERYKPWVDDAARSIAYLAAIDGATVVNKNFEVLGFGVKLKAPQKVTATERVTTISPLESDSASDEVPVDEEFRGTRHLSAASSFSKTLARLLLLSLKMAELRG
jgi:hypothetical protein